VNHFPALNTLSSLINRFRRTVLPLYWAGRGFATPGSSGLCYQRAAHAVQEWHVDQGWLARRGSSPESFADAERSTDKLIARLSQGQPPDEIASAYSELRDAAASYRQAQREMKTAWVAEDKLAAANAHAHAADAADLILRARVALWVAVRDETGLAAPAASS
jgi:hypothetical protein